MSEKPSFREGPIYPVLFMVLVSLAFMGVLALMYRSSEGKIQRQQQGEYERAILSLCAERIAAAEGSSAEAILAAYPASFKQYLKPLPEGTYPRRAYALTLSGKQVAYVFDIGGKGLWGTMRALAATNPAADTLYGFTVYQQSETPGLGSRVTEDWFTAQFIGKPVISQGKPVDYVLIPEDQTATAANQLRQVTGATITTSAVAKMLRDELAAVWQGGRK